MFWSTSWTNGRVWTSVSVLLRCDFVLSESLTVAVCVVNKEVQSSSGAVQKMVRLKVKPGRRDREQDTEQEGDENGFLGEQNYIQALGADMEGEPNILLVHLFTAIRFS